MLQLYIMINSSDCGGKILQGFCHGINLIMKFSLKHWLWGLLQKPREISFTKETKTSSKSSIVFNSITTMSNVKERNFPFFTTVRSVTGHTAENSAPQNNQIMQAQTSMRMVSVQRPNQNNNMSTPIKNRSVSILVGCSRFYNRLSHSIHKKKRTFLNSKKLKSALDNLPILKDKNQQGT